MDKDYIVKSGRTISNLKLNYEDSLEIEYGGFAYNTQIGSDATEYDEGYDSGSVILKGGIETIAQGGVAAGTIISSGGEQYVDGGEVVSAYVYNGGRQYIGSGVASSTAVFSGGDQFVGGSKGTYVVGTTLSGGTQTINRGFSSMDTDSLDGGIIDVSGTAESSTLLGGYAVIFSGGVAKTTTVSSGGDLQVDPFGTAFGVIVSDGGFAIIFNSTKTSGLTVGSGGHIVHDYEIFDGTIKSNLILREYQYAQIDGGGTASNSKVESGATLVNSGYIFETLVATGGYEFCDDGTDLLTTLKGVSLSGLPTSGMTHSSQGYQILFGDAMASATTIERGGWQDVAGDLAISSQTTVLSGGLLEVDAGGTAKNETIDSGGELLLYENASVSGLIIKPGAVIYLDNISATSIDVSTAGENVIEVKIRNAMVEDIFLSGNNSDTTFTLKSNGAGGTEILVGSKVSATSAVGSTPLKEALAGFDAMPHEYNFVLVNDTKLSPFLLAIK